MIGAQASSEQLEKILSYIKIGKEEGAGVLAGGERNVLPGDLAGGYYVQPTAPAPSAGARSFLPGPTTVGTLRGGSLTRPALALPSIGTMLLRGALFPDGALAPTPADGGTAGSCSTSAASRVVRAAKRRPGRRY